MHGSYWNPQPAPIQPVDATVPGATDPDAGSDGLYEFDGLSLQQQRGAMVDMLNKIPKVPFYQTLEPTFLLIMDS